MVEEWGVLLENEALSRGKAIETAVVVIVPVPFKTQHGGGNVVQC